MHAAQGFAYDLPDLANPLFLSKLVVEDDAGRLAMASLVRLTSEVYLLADPRAGTPRERWHLLLALHAAAERDARARGLDDAHCWLPPQVARSFGRRLLRLGWRRPLWTCFARELGDSAPTRSGPAALALSEAEGASSGWDSCADHEPESRRF
jgi:hypothetical protein